MCSIQSLKGGGGLYKKNAANYVMLAITGGFYLAVAREPIIYRQMAKRSMGLGIRV